MKPCSIIHPTLFGLLALPLLLISCGEKSDEPGDPNAATAVDPALESVFTDSAPAEAISVVQARQSAAPGDEIVVTGKIAGAMHPFTEGFAMLVLADQALQTCDLIPGDECPTPWDACCATPEELKAQRLTIRVNGPDGTIVPASLEGVQGLDELDSLVVSGKVAAESTPENLVVDVDSIHRKSQDGRSPVQ